MRGYHNYDLNPVVRIESHGEGACLEGWNEVAGGVKECLPAGKYTVAIECYPGVMLDALRKRIAAAFPQCTIVNVEAAYLDAAVLREQFKNALTTDPVFGRMEHWPIANYFDERRTAVLRATIEQSSSVTFVIGAGTQHVLAKPDLRVHANVTRWELQKRQRNKSICNLGLENYEDSAQLLYKNAYFLEWRVADEIRHSLYDRIDYFLDLDDQEIPRMVRGDVLREAVAAVVRQPFRVVPFFDPGPWGGYWMMRTFDLPQDVPNYAWCFDCVPEENGVMLAFGTRRFQLPAIVLVHERPTLYWERRFTSTLVRNFPSALISWTRSAVPISRCRCIPCASISENISEFRIPRTRATTFSIKAAILRSTWGFAQERIASRCVKTWQMPRQADLLFPPNAM
jgi:hypothetical protein